MHVALLIALAALQSPQQVKEEAAFKAFLKAVDAKVEHEHKGEATYGPRPYIEYTTKADWKIQRKHIASNLVAAGWWFYPGPEYGFSQATSANMELRFHPQTGTIWFRRQAKWLREIRNGRRRFTDELDLADIGFAHMLSEGILNRVLFRAGATDKLFFVHGEPFHEDRTKQSEPLYLSAFGRVGGKPARLWQVRLVPGQAKTITGTLYGYLRFNKWQVETLPPEAKDDLALVKPLAYYNNNHGAGGTDVGFVDKEGNLKVVSGSLHGGGGGAEVTIDEERYLVPLRTKK